MRRISKYVLLAALLGASATTSFASLRGTKDAAASEDKTAYRSYTVSATGDKSGAGGFAGEMHPRPHVETMSGAGGFAGEMHPRPRVETMSGGGAGFAGEVHPKHPDPRAAESDEDGIDMPRKLSGAGGFAGEMHPRPRVETMSGGGAGFAGEVHPRHPDPRAAESDEDGIDMPRKLSGAGGFAGEMHPRPRVETMSGGGAGFAGEVHPRKPATQAVVAEEDDYGIDMPRKLSGAGGMAGLVRPHRPEEPALMSGGGNGAAGIVRPRVKEPMRVTESEKMQFMSGGAGFAGEMHPRPRIETMSGGHRKTIDPRAAPFDEDDIDMPRKLSGAGGFAGEMHPRPHVETMSGGGAGFAGEMGRPRRTDPRAQEESDGGYVDVPRV